MDSELIRDLKTGSASTLYWSSTADGRVRCDLCPRHCTLRDGQRGFCYVRSAREGRIVLNTYGRTSGFCIDPVEKKPLFHFLPGTPTFSFGTVGCNLGCSFCQNWNISKERSDERLGERADPEAIARAAANAACRSISYTYNDPTVFHEYAIDTAVAARSHGLKNIAVTAGWICAEPRSDLYAVMDAANVDLKGFTAEFYRKQCQATLEPVLETLEYIRHETKVWLEITTLLIPGLNDSDKEIDEMTAWIAARLGDDVPLHFTAFHPDFRLTSVAPTPTATLRRARARARENGLKHVYTGNVLDEEGGATYCAGCKSRIIGRDGYAITDWNLDGAACRRCGATCAGIFEIEPGAFGNQRRRVALA